MTYVVGHHKRKILRYRKEKSMADAAGLEKKYTGDLSKITVETAGQVDIEEIEGDAQALIQLAEGELTKAKAAKEKAERASGEAQGEAAEAQAKTAEEKKDEARYHAARAIVYAKAAQEKAKAQPAAGE